MIISTAMLLDATVATTTQGLHACIASSSYPNGPLFGRLERAATSFPVSSYYSFSGARQLYR